MERLTMPWKTAYAHLGMLLWALLVGLSFPAVGMMSEGLPSLSLTALRFAIAALVLWPLIHRDHKRVPNLEGLIAYCVMGLCLAGLFSAMFWAAHRVTALTMAAIYVSIPLLAYCLGRWLRVQARAPQLLGILLLGAVGALGLDWAQASGQTDPWHLGFGELVYFLGCLASALYPVVSKWGLNRGVISQDTAARTFWSLLSGSILIGLIGLIVERPLVLLQMSGVDALLLVYLGVFSTGLTYWLMQKATAILTPSDVTSYSYLVPFVSMLLLFASNPSRISWVWLPGSILILFTMVLLLRYGGTDR